MKKLLLLIIPILLFITTVNINVKADSDNGWYTPDLQNYTFSIPYDDIEHLKFIFNDAVTGDFVAYFDREFDFGISQDSNGALNFVDIENTINWVGSQSIENNGYGVTPLINGLPSFVSYTIDSTYEPWVYINAIDRHVIIFRLDLMGNYSMLLDDYIYDIVYTLEIIYQIKIIYEEKDYILYRDYAVHWLDTNDMQEYTVYEEMDSNLIHFQLKKIGDSENDYEQGYQDGFIDGEKSKIAKNNESFYNNIAIWIPATITLVALASIITFFGIKKKE